MPYSSTSYRICFAAFLLLGGCHQILGQSSSIPFHTYPMSVEIEKGLAEGEMRITRAAQFYSYIGEYQAAATVPHEVALEWGFDTLRPADQIYFQQFEAKDAVQGIVERAGQEQIVMINEAHHKPAHRVFTRRLLEGLYQKGYRYFGLEALSNCAYVPKEFCDDQLNERGFPYNSPLSGTYVTEPQMSNLIREAIDLGFTIFPYEKFGQDREKEQARYIAQVLEKDPEAKILIHCGWYHLLEQANQGRTWMAAYLREQTGIDPFTIYQDILVERSSGQESPFYTLMDYQQPMVFINDAGDFYNGFRDFELFDALVYHPRAIYRYNRPQWLINYGNNRVYPLPKDQIEVDFPCLVMAYREGDPNTAVPTDIIQLEYRHDPTALVLPPGSYRLSIKDKIGENQEIEITVE